MADSWFSTDSQQNLYKATTERSLLIVKQAMAKRMQADVAKVEAKYDGKKAAAIEEEVNKLGDQKLELSAWMSSMDSALKEFNTVREYMLQVKGTMAADTPNPEAFDLYYDALNSALYTEKYDDKSLISNSGNGRGSWSAATTTISAGGMDASLPHHYLGNDLVIQLDDGGVMTTDLKGQLSGDGKTISRANLKLVSNDGTNVEFQDLTDPGNPVTYTGTLKRGGLGVLPSWLYGDLSDPTVKQTVQNDLAAAFKKLARYELDFNVAQAQLSGVDTTLGNKMTALTDEYKKVSTEETDAKTAEKKAIKARFDLVNNSLALTSGRQSNFIQQMFNTKPPAKKTLTDALFTAAGFGS